MDIEVRTLQVGRTSWVHEFIATYEKKISYFNSFSTRLVRDESDLLKNIAPKDYVLLCDEKGDSLDSRQFAVNLQSLLESGKQNLFLLVGGPFGVSDEVKDRANRSLRLSKLVLNQEIALAVLYEQLFRAFTINNNHPYHND